MTYFIATLILWTLIFSLRNASGPIVSLHVASQNQASRVDWTATKCDYPLPLLCKPVTEFDVVKTFGANGLVVRVVEEDRKVSMFMRKEETISSALSRLSTELRQAKLRGMARNETKDLENAIKERALVVLSQCEDIRDRMRVIAIATSTTPITEGVAYMNDASEEEFGLLAPLIAAGQQRINA